MGLNKLTVINFKSIDEFKVQPEGKSFTLEGHNGAGKSAVIEAIEWALRGRIALSDGAMKQGADYTEVIYEGDEFKVVRKWKRGKSPTIKVTDKDGKIWTSPQGMLDDIVSNLSFDPTAFLKMKPKEQVEALKSLIDPDGKIDKMESEKAIVYDKRTDAGREKARLQGAFISLKHFPDAPDAEVSSDVLLKNLEDAKSKHDLHNSANEHIERSKRQAKEMEQNIKDLKDRIIMEEQNLDNCTANIKHAESEIAEIGKLPDLEPLKQAFTDADETNKQVRANQAWAKAKVELSKASNIHAGLEIEHATYVDSIDKFIRDQKLPVKGLSFSPDCLMLDAKQFNDCSDGERLRTSVLISMAMNPKLKIIAIKNGSLLDDVGKKIIFDLAREHKYQVIMEIVKSGDLSCEIEQEFVGADNG